MIAKYRDLPPAKRERFDRAAYWMDMASRQWDVSMSLSFASLVAAVEALTERGAAHRLHCPDCDETVSHEHPGATKRFKDFFEIYAPGGSSKRQRDDMYSLRSGILHGSELMKLDHDLAQRWDPPWWNERELHAKLWTTTQTAIRNWLASANGINREHAA